MPRSLDEAGPKQELFLGSCSYITLTGTKYFNYWWQSLGHSNAKAARTPKQNVNVSTLKSFNVKTLFVGHGGKCNKIHMKGVGRIQFDVHQSHVFPMHGFYS